MKNYILRILLTLKMAMINHLYLKPLIKETHNPQDTQKNLLMRILKQNRGTVYGKEHGFKNIKNYKQFRKAVPVNQYESLRCYIENQESSKLSYLNPTQPLMYVQTSGSTGKPKVIPVLKNTISQYRTSQHIAACSQFGAVPGAYEGKVLAIVSPAVEGRLATGATYGSMSGLIYKSMPALMRTKYVVPPEVFEIEDYDQKYYQIALHGLAEKNVTTLATANPSTLIKLDKDINQHAWRIIGDIKTVNPGRADELRLLLTSEGILTFSKVWPNLKSVTTWTGGSCSFLIPELKKKLPVNTPIIELGYLSSEFRGGITIDVKGNREIPTLHENFFEFVEKGDWENKMPEFLTLDQIQSGKQYYIFATTQNGLYRYDINDIVEVTGMFNNTPTIRFVQKGKGVTNLTGEKLHENQLIQAMEKAVSMLGINTGFFVMLGCPEKLEYTLYIEHEFLDEFEIETHLDELNIEFESKRKSGRLKPLRIVYLKDGTGEIYKQHCLDNGQRESQYKLAYLQYKKKCSFDFSQHAR